MIKPASAHRGLVFRDPQIPTARQFFRLADQLSDGSWRAEQVTDKRTKPTRVYTPRDLERLEPVPSDPIVEYNLDALLGKRVKMKTTFGQSSGLVTEVVTQEITITGERFVVPVALNVGGDRYELHHIQSVELRDA